MWRILLSGFLGLFSTMLTDDNYNGLAVGDLIIPEDELEAVLKELEKPLSGIEGKDYVVEPNTGRLLHPQTLQPIETYVDFTNREIL